MLVLSFPVASIASPSFPSSKCQSTVGSEAALECSLVQVCGCEKLPAESDAASQCAYLYYALEVCTLLVKKKYTLLSV